MKVSMILICSDAGEKAQEVRRDALAERRDLAVEFIFCLVLVEVLKQLPFHPGHNDLLSRVEIMAFAHFKHKEGCVVQTEFTRVAWSARPRWIISEIFFFPLTFSVAQARDEPERCKHAPNRRFVCRSRGRPCPKSVSFRAPALHDRAERVEVEGAGYTHDAKCASSVDGNEILPCQGLSPFFYCKTRSYSSFKSVLI